MTPERYQQLKGHFYALIDCDGDVRREYMGRLSEEDRAEVESLLSAGGEETIGSPIMRIREPATIGDYAIKRELGRGGMGVVYLAQRGDETFALKLIKRGLDTDAIVARFRREHHILGTLDHANVARVLDGGTSADGRPYFVMEYVDGKPLDESCAGKSIEQRLSLFESVCRAVHYAHERGVVHRDLKPGNILVTADGTPKLLDFGIAKVLDDSGSTVMTTLTQTGQQLLTPAYASPEQIHGGEITPASDVYSLGVMLYELLTGERPFGRASTPRGIAKQLESRTPSRPSRVVDGLPDGVDHIVLTAMARGAAERYPSAVAMADDLARVLQGHGVRGRKQTPAAKWTTAAVLATIIAGIALVTTHRDGPAIHKRDPVTLTTYNQADNVVRIRDAEAGVARDPGSVDGWVSVAQLRASAYFLGFDRSDDNERRAAGALRRAQRLAPNATTVHLAAARVAYSLHRDFTTAMNEARLALRQDPGNADAFSMVGYARRRLGAFDDSRRDLRTAARLAPGNPVFVAQLALDDIYRRHYDDARKEFETGLQIAPESSELRAALIELRWLNGGKPEDAAPLLAGINDDVNITSFAGTVRYLYHLYSRQYRQAAKDIESAPVNTYVLSDFSNDHVPRDLLVGNAYALAGDQAAARTRYEAARAQLESTLTIDPQDPLLHAALGRVYAGLGKEDDALREANAAVNLAPPSKDALIGAVCTLHRARVEAATGHNDEALADLRWLLDHPAPVTPALLRLDPAWDPLRNDSRFQALASPPAPVRGERYSENAQAHTEYLQARFEFTKRTPESLRAARASLLRAVGADPKFALGWSALADTYAISAFYGLEDQPTMLRKCREAGERAQAIDPTLAEAVASTAQLPEFLFDWEASERAFQKSIALNARYAPAHHWYAFFLVAEGRFDEALHQIREAQEIDPVSPIFIAAEGVVLNGARRYDEAIVPLKAIIERNPAFHLSYFVIANSYAGKGDYASAIASCKKALTLVPGDHFALAMMAWNDAHVGRSSEARTMAADAERAYAEHHFQPSLVAMVWAGLGDSDRTLRWLNKAADDHDPVLPLFLKYREFDLVRGDQRYAQLLRRMHLS